MNFSFFSCAVILFFFCCCCCCSTVLLKLTKCTLVTSQNCFCPWRAVHQLIFMGRQRSQVLLCHLFLPHQNCYLFLIHVFLCNRLLLLLTRLLCWSINIKGHDSISALKFLYMCMFIYIAYALYYIQLSHISPKVQLNMFFLFLWHSFEWTHSKQWLAYGPYL